MKPKGDGQVKIYKSQFTGMFYSLSSLLSGSELSAHPHGVPTLLKLVCVGDDEKVRLITNHQTLHRFIVSITPCNHAYSPSLSSWV